jgi:hypothetical protein
LQALTASLKAASIVSSSQQIQNYNTFARTGSVNTFYGNQGISGSLNVTSATGTNVIPQLTVNNTTTNGYGILRLVGAGRGGLIDFYNTSSAQASIVANDGALQIYTNGDSTGTPKVTIDSVGKFGINKTTPGATLDVNGNTVVSGSIYQLQGDFNTSTFLNAAAIFYHGFSKARGTSASPLTIANNDLIGGLSASPYDGSSYFSTSRLEFKVTGAVSTGNVPTSCRILTGTTGAVQTFIVDQSGNVGAPSGTNIYNASDVRLKQNITSISGSLNSVLALNPVKFNWIDNFVESENGKDMLGFVAQEVQPIIPEVVEGFGAGSIFVGETEIDNPLRVNEKFLIPVLTKAIQEQQAIIDSLIARIEALENN